MGELRYPNESREYLSRCARLIAQGVTRTCRQSEICGAETAQSPPRRAVERGLRLPVGERWKGNGRS